MVDDKTILNLLFKNEYLRTCLLNYSKYICNGEAATNLLNTSTKYFSTIEDSKNVTFDDLNVVFNSEFSTDSEELTLWKDVKELEISNYDVITSAVIKHIRKQLKESFFAEAFIDDNYNLDKLEELYTLLDSLSNYDKNNSDKNESEDIILDDVEDCCDCYNTTTKEGVKFFDSRISDTLSSKQFDCGTINVVVGAPGRGKTQVILNQGIFVASQKQYTLHVAIGDLTKKQLLIRLLAIITGNTMQQISLLSPEQFKKYMLQVKAKYPDIFKYFHGKTYLPNTHTGIELIKEIEKLQKKRNIHYTQVVIDYDGNIETELSSSTKKSDKEKNMYYAGADIYNNFVSFAKRNNTVVWVLSQPKTQYWSIEKIPLEALADSSKKGHIIDFCMSIGKKDVTEDQCTFFISKNRHGESNKCYFSRQIGSTQKFEPITSWDE